ncbi:MULTISPECIES: Gfo/Idh/MocA family protein [Paeniglutamicibacter]|jgi:predicted dehydrogenase|uniref:Gfo/Idh/MocA family oxidoreductase n=1 Tax=Paeniglutamicibacter terrestris TaxID=2723403 RepID=A0ABX1G525_9MICC|nr:MULTISPECIES: Gfo/Idh/MocA family oxidoreductase [Paeniglutamicibacter]ASN40301.1 oxidoreductase [Arthrobacter sp. 7749]NKG21357.1 Gfo/Idh/MocA family oxidoreductase [Paeniglutamicibacter terrestris]QXQ11009.1 Gfo/Idh/MocA family oxidoreductase [Paeniglutamicibacter sp. Y32M11]
MEINIQAPPTAHPGAPSPIKATGRSLNWGIVSTGSIVGKVVADLQSLEDANVIAVSSRSEKRARAFADEHDIEWAYGSYEAMFAEPEIEAVYIGTPHAQHFEIAMAALRAGKHVVCEKSLTINAAEARALALEAHERDLFLMEAVWSRFTPVFARALDILDSGELGEPTWVQADLGFTAEYDPQWRIWDRDAGGGALLDLAVYPMTWAIAAFGFPTSVQALGEVNDDGVDVQTAVTLGYPEGRHAQLMVSLNSTSTREARVACTNGWLGTNAPLHNPTKLFIHPADGPARTEVFEAVGANYTFEFREATRCIQQDLNESPTMPWEHSVNTIAVFDGIRHQLGIRYPNDVLVG